MELSIVICTYNRSYFLREGLEVIVKQRLLFIDVPIEIIVIDNNWEINLFSLNHKIILNKVSVARAPTKK